MVVRSIRLFIQQADQSHGNNHAERLMFALSTLFDATRLDIQFYLIHGWVPQNTLKAMLCPTPVPERPVYQRRRKLQRVDGYGKACAEECPTISLRPPNAKMDGVIRTPEISISERGRRMFIHSKIADRTNRLKPRALFPKRQAVTVDVNEEEDLDVVLLQEDSWETDAQKDQYEVVKNLDLRWCKKPRTSKMRREYLVK
ncbi:reverse transcriptase [Phytophthora megakarya]|uniref:Reverse transcriptase n=1 Tax=Phytophthora megakarya TaxID=4795 RepID=A0A225WB78_9STRA|nr:reverse transcriptase [Phytophthora megakarya]